MKYLIDKIQILFLKKCELLTFYMCLNILTNCVLKYYNLS